MASILAVDDEPDVLAVVQATLELAGHEVSTASNGREALAKVKRHAFDAMILDIMMPEVDGYQVLEGLRAMENRAGMPVIVLTAKHDPSGVGREVAWGAVDHIAKPFLPSELEAAVERALGSVPEAVEERRRALSKDAEVYGSLNDLFESVRLGDDAASR